MSIQPFVDDAGDAPRFVGLDAARGFLVLGIIFANMTSLLTWRSSPGVLGGQVVVYSLLKAIFSGKFRCALYFIAGIAIAIQDQSTSKRALMGLRYTTLLVIGALHGVFIWFGDILTTYGFVGLLLILIKETPRRLPSILMATFSISFMAATAYVTWRLWLGEPPQNLLKIVPADDSFSGRIHYYITHAPDTFYAFPCMLLGTWYFESKFKHARLDILMCLLIVTLASSATFVLSNQVSLYRPWVAPLPGNAAISMSAIKSGISDLIAALAGPVLGILLINIFAYCKRATIVRALAVAGRYSLSIYLMTSVIVTPFAYLVQATNYRVHSELEMIGYGFVVLLINLILVWIWSRSGRRGPFEQIFIDAAKARASSS